MINQSKINDYRFWKKWRESGAVGTFVKVPYFFLVTDKYIIGTSKGMESSERTIDISFKKFVDNNVLQEKLHLLSCVLANPSVTYAKPPYTKPLSLKRLRQGVVDYLNSFSENFAESEQKRKYLMKNGLIRVLITDDILREDIKKIV